MDESDLDETQQGSSVCMATGAVYAAQGRTAQARTEFEHALRNPPAMVRDRPLAGH